MTRTLLLLIHATTLAAFAGPSMATDTVQASLKLATAFCKQPNDIPAPLSDHEYSEKEIIVRGASLGREKLFSSTTGSVKVDLIQPVGRPKRTALSASAGNDINQPGIWIMLDADCNLLEARRAVFDDNNTALYIETLDASLTVIGDPEWLNPPLSGKGKIHGLRVALIDSGVNYTLDTIAESLALNTNGELIGYDYWDHDSTPFDANPARTWFVIQRHGTRTASILLREAPDIALVPYRYPRPDMSRMTDLIDHAAANDIRIIGMPLGSNNYQEWADFSKAVDAHPEILFIVSAGNHGRDIDLNPVYPAAFDHQNILVVTSADDYARPAARTNYGKLSVDYLLPAERISALDFNGKQTEVSGSSYAVSRLTALAARILTKDSDININQLKDKIAAFSVRANTGRYVSTGYIGDPTADISNVSSLKDSIFKPVSSSATYTARINLISLTDKWTTEKITASLNEVNKIYNQCGLAISTKALLRVEGADYIANLSPGSALTLSRHLEEKLDQQAATVYFAADTDMETKFDAEAFGKGNTSNRPWMKNSLWVTSVTPDSGNAIAHELFHILTNSGQHSTQAGNLMQVRTSPENTVLSIQQCQSAISSAKESGLIR